MGEAFRVGLHGIFDVPFGCGGWVVHFWNVRRAVVEDYGAESRGRERSRNQGKTAWGDLVFPQVVLLSMISQVAFKFISLSSRQ
jgi:hypothetical protein